MGEAGPDLLGISLDSFSPCFHSAKRQKGTPFTKHSMNSSVPENEKTKVRTFSRRYIPRLTFCFSPSSWAQNLVVTVMANNLSLSLSRAVKHSKQPVVPCRNALSGASLFESSPARFRCQHALINSVLVREVCGSAFLGVKNTSYPSYPCG